jgi:SAM-dependent methyltransferase
VELRQDSRLHGLMVCLASLTMALGAANLFALQPMIGKLLAPWLGSAPAVWTTCLLFFQVVLLVGYVYVHWLTQSMEVKHQLLLHGVIILLSLIALPLALPGFMTSNIPADGFHAYWIFATLVITVGAPAFVLATTAPLVQAWFGRTTHRLAANPYPLYIASNAGSLIGLVSYPFILEPNLTLTLQRKLWSGSWIIYSLLLGSVALICWRHLKVTFPPTDTSISDPEEAIAGREGRFLGMRTLRWVALSFVPSSMLLGVTNHMTTDIAAMPMLWTIPLAIYLFSWTVSFSDYASGLHRCMKWIAPMAVIAAAFVWAAEFRGHFRWVLSIHMAALLTACWALHRRLYETRPETSHLTNFYIAIALGGALGGIFNAIVAPLIFSGFAEYPLALVASLLLLPGGMQKPGDSVRVNKSLSMIWQQALLMILAVICAAALSKYVYQSIRWQLWNTQSFASRIGWTTEQVEKWAEFMIPLIPALLLVGRPKFQAAAIGSALLVGVCINMSNNILIRERSFFGVLTVREYRNNGHKHSLIHGGILHGEQWFTGPADRFEARSYYHKDGPLGDVMDIMAQKKETFSIAAIGLGTGSIAAYGQPNRPITFFEIDSKVEAIARNPKYFTYLTDCLQRGGPIEVRIGDARVMMSKATESFDVIVVDAFSSDSIPLHLITREAIDGWFRCLQSDGVLAFHISNRYVDLTPVLANAAESMGVSAFASVDNHGDAPSGRSGSSWLVLIADPKMICEYEMREDWHPPATRPELPVWTDDFASVLPVLRL